MSDDQKSQSSDDPKPPKKGAAMGDLSYGLEFGITAILGMVAGHWLEKKWGFAPWGLLGGLFLGAILGMINLTRKLK